MGATQPFQNRAQPLGLILQALFEHVPVLLSIYPVGPLVDHAQPTARARQIAWCRMRSNLLISSMLSSILGSPAEPTCSSQEIYVCVPFCPRARCPFLIHFAEISLQYLRHPETSTLATKVNFDTDVQGGGPVASRQWREYGVVEFARSRRSCGF